MAGPFPGMDPYLEDPAGWPDVHDGLIGCMRAILNTLLPSDYVARSEERCYVVQTEREIIPDLTIRKKTPPRHSAGGVSSGVVMESDPSFLIPLSPLEMREATLEIVHVGEGRRVVTAIEILSPSNKAPHTKGHRLYRKKQREMLTSRTHFIEIDLLRAGEHTVLAPQETLRQETEWHYLVCLCRAERPRVLQVWPNKLQAPLPQIKVPLDSDVPDVDLDLQAVFDRNYSEGAYHREVDYARDPIPPLEGKEALWADALLRERGLRG